jgi:Bacterial aa3 type cytochrome c oxidase subunit IV
MGNDNMDYKEHDRTYGAFMSMIKWGIPFSIILFGFLIYFTRGN